MSIYLYIKQHQKTGLKYFGKTKNEPTKYAGSGKYWLRHIKKHGKFIDTLWYKEFKSLEKLKRFSTLFSKLNQIVESKEWANLAIENGTDGGPRVISDEHKKTISQANTGRSFSEEHKRKISESNKGVSRPGGGGYEWTNEQRRQASERLKNNNPMHDPKIRNIDRTGQGKGRKLSKTTREKISKNNSSRIKCSCIICGEEKSVNGLRQHYSIHKDTVF
jgi:hypothetical protein